MDEVDDAVGAAVLPLTVGENPMEAFPFCGLPGVVFEPSVQKRPGNLIACAEVSEQGERDSIWPSGNGEMGLMAG